MANQQQNQPREAQKQDGGRSNPMPSQKPGQERTERNPSPTERRDDQFDTEEDVEQGEGPATRRGY